jgi:uncharacterized membrane protein YkoI
MKPRHWRARILGLLAPIGVALCLLAAAGCGKGGEAEEDEAQEPAETQQEALPTTIWDALTARFPGAEIREWAREEEEGAEIFDIEFTQGGRNAEADIRADGTFVNFETAIPAEELPEVVMATVEARYPGATLQEILQITEVTDEGELLGGYEVVLVTPEGAETELTIAPDGTVLEEGDEGAEEG